MPTPKSEPKPVKRDEHVDALAERKKAIELKELEAKEADIDLNLKSLRQALEPPKTIEEIYRGRVKNANDAKQLYAEIDVKYANDPAEKEMRRLIVDDIMRGLL
jgi:predicted phage-related endonuclease